MADMITRCPKCATAFRISDTMLRSAKGVVRCGSCLSVFNAREHLETSSRPAPPTAAPKTSADQSSASANATQQPAPSPPRARAIEQPAKPRNLTASRAAPAADTQATPSVPDEGNVQTEFESAYPGSTLRSGADDHDHLIPSAPPEDLEDVDDDEAWALELLKDDSDLNIQLKKVIPAKPSPEGRWAKEQAADVQQPASEASNPELGGSELDEPPRKPATYPTPEAYAAEILDQDAQMTDAEEALADALLAESDDLPELDDLPETAGYGAHREASITEDAAVTANASITEPAAVETELPHPENTATTAPAAPSRKPIRPNLDDKPGIREMIATLEADPLEVPWQDDKGRWKKRLVWPVLALLALLMLLVQIAWLEFDRLSRLEPYRGFYAIACRHLGCALPDLVDRSQIQTANLLVRSHPEIAGVLLVDVILQNNAPFEQPFPKLQLTFTDLRNQPVSVRQLTPDDYLGGELAGRTLMPLRQPIYIAMEIDDPGSDAVSYQIAIID